MDKEEKIIAKIRQRSSNVHLSEVDFLLIEKYKFECRRTKHTYTYTNGTLIIAISCHYPILVPEAVRELKKLLDDLLED